MKLDGSWLVAKSRSVGRLHVIQGIQEQVTTRPFKQVMTHETILFRFLVVQDQFELNDLVSLGYRIYHSSVSVCFS